MKNKQKVSRLLQVEELEARVAPDVTAVNPAGLSVNENALSSEVIRLAEAADEPLAPGLNKDSGNFPPGNPR
jgi:hypothetical protein